MSCPDSASRQVRLRETDGRATEESAEVTSIGESGQIKLLTTVSPSLSLCSAVLSARVRLRKEEDEGKEEGAGRKSNY